jgi:hypothetical protein
MRPALVVALQQPIQSSLLDPDVHEKLTAAPQAPELGQAGAKQAFPEGGGPGGVGPGSAHAGSNQAAGPLSMPGDCQYRQPLPRGLYAHLPPEAGVMAGQCARSGQAREQPCPGRTGCGSPDSR